MKTHVPNIESCKNVALAILTRHVGVERAVGMGELYVSVYGNPWQHRINDTRRLRALITELRWEGALIGETRSKQGGGYYLARSTHELGMFFERRTHEAVKKLAMIARMKQIGLPELLGQMQLNLREGGNGNDGGAEDLCG